MRKGNPVIAHFPGALPDADFPGTALERMSGLRPAHRPGLRPSCAASPNCSDADARFTVTVRPVQPGEELTCDYLAFDEESRERGLVWRAP